MEGGLTRYLSSLSTTYRVSHLLNTRVGNLQKRRRVQDEGATEQEDEEMHAWILWYGVSGNIASWM